MGKSSIITMTQETGERKIKMDDCKGWMGKIFGHCFKSKIVEYIPQNTSINVKWGSVDDVKEIIDKYSTKKFKIVCKRCGKILGE